MPSAASAEIRLSAAAGAAPATGPSALGAPLLMGFSLGMIGDRIFRDAPALLLLIFMTNYLGVPPALAGVAIFVPKLLIVFVDPLVGLLSDRLDTRWGRRRPLMAAGAVLAGVSIVLFFHVPRFESAPAQALYMSFIVLLGFTGYSLNSVPYLTMASEVAGSDGDRSRIMSWRVAFMAIGLSISAYAGAVVEALGGGVGGYSRMSWLYAGICLLTMGATVAATGRMKTTPAATLTLSLPQQFRLVAGNRRFLNLLLVGFAQKTAEGVGYGSFAYFCIYVVEQPLSGIGLVVMSSVVGMVLSQPLWLRVARRLPMSTLYTVGALLWCLNLVLWLAMKGQAQWWLIPLGLQGGMAAGGFLMVTLTMLSQTLAEDTARTGQNREGVFSGVWLATEKLAFAFGALIVGVMLALFGFVESKGGAAVTQTPLAVVGIAITYSGVNLVVYLASIAAMRRVARQASQAPLKPQA
jgi:GPH family glycoside/pentoside/hexuronide:cation symporter